MSINFTENKINDRFTLYFVQNGNAKNTFSLDVINGLQANPKTLPPKYFYDFAGSILFDKICLTSEYYVTRTEASILEKHSDEIARVNSEKKIIIELGSGSSIKTRYILNSFIKLNTNLTYVPIDLSEILVQSGKELLKDFEGLSIKGIIGEYEESISAASEIFHEPKLIVFLGSSIGNFDLHHAEIFLKNLSSNMKHNDSLLIGFDLVKDINVLNAAYNDNEGITAEFNLNLLKRINNELSSNINVNNFEHKAFFNSDKSRIEMHLVSKCIQSFSLKGSGLISFKKNETIHTENSYKFTDEMIMDLARNSGLKINNAWKDPQNYFGLCLMSK